MTDRIVIKETSSTFSPETHFTGDLESTISILQDWKEEGEWEGIEECWEQDCCCPSYQLYKNRPETDKEYAKRMKEREKEKKQIKQNLKLSLKNYD